MTSPPPRRSPRLALAGAALCLFSSWASGALTDGLISHWKFDDGAGVTAVDSGSLGNDGTLTGGVSWLTSGSRVGGDIVVNGTNPSSKVEAAVSINASTYTFSQWIYPYSNTNLYPTIQALHDSQVERIWLYYYSATGLVALQYLNQALVTQTAISNMAVSLNQWNHIAVVFEETTGKVDFYKNGTFAQTITLTNVDDITWNTRTAGNFTGNADHVFNGRLDDMRIYNRRLSAEEISTIAQKGLVGHWPLDEASGTSAFDASGNYSTGTVTVPSWTTGKIGGSLSFDGSGIEPVAIGHKSVFNGTTAYAVSAWVYNSAPACNCSISSIRTIVQKGFHPFNSTGGFSLGWQAKDDSNTPGYTFGVRRSDDVSYSYAYYNNTVKNVWQHIVGVFDNGNVSIYGNGVLKDGPDFIGTTGMLNNTQPLRIGSDGANSESRWTGMIDDVRIYNRVLTAGEILELYQLGVSPDPAGSLSPQRGAIDVSSVTVSWSTVSAFGYILEASTDSSFTGAVFSSATIAPGAGQLTVPGLGPNATYFLRVSVASDAFNSTTLNSVWVTSDTAGDGSFSLSSNPGRLRLSRPANTTGLLSVVRDVPNINGVFETKIDGINLDASLGTQGGGLFLKQDDDDHIQFFYWQSGGGHKIVAFQTTGGSVTEPIPRQNATLGSANYIRVTKQGSFFTLQHRQDNGAWATAGSMNAPGFTVAKAGLRLTSEDNPPAIAANFDYFTGPYSLTTPTATVTLAAAPNAVSFGNIGTSQFQVRWGVNGNPAGTSYDVRIATSIDFTTVSATAATTSSHTLFTGLASNTTFFTRVRAVNFGGVQTSDALGAVVTAAGVITVSADKVPNVWSNALTTVFFAQGAGATRFFYRITANASDPAQTTDTEFDGSATVASVAEGVNYIHVVGTDPGLTVIGRATFGPITIDRSSPTVFAVSAQRSATNTTPILDGGSTFISTPRVFWVGTSISPIVGYSYSISQNPITTPGTTINTTLNFADISLGQPGTYYVKVRALSLAGNFSDPAGISFTYGAVPDVNAVTIRKNYFNPIRGECARLDIQAASAGKIKAVVYTLLGQKVASLADQEAPAGSYTFTWCGRNDAGQVVATGGYLLRVEAPGHKKTLKLAVGK